MTVQEVAEKWVKEKRMKSIPGGGSVEEYKRVNKEESVRLADAFLAYPFLNVSTNLCFYNFNFLELTSKKRIV